MSEAARPLPHDTVIQESWSRCREFGLSHHSVPRFSLPSRDEVAALLERQQALVKTTHQEVLPCYDTILANSNCLILLADGDGHVLHAWGEQRFATQDQAAGFVSGACWLERHTGTNAIGTALSCRQAVHIQHDEHFLKANRFMSGSAAPIFDAQRRLIAVLDVSSDRYLPPSHTLGMVRMMSQSVENRLILNLFREDCFQLSFNTSLSNLGSPWAGLLIVDEQGRVLCANRRAERLLGLDAAGASLDELFDLPLPQLLGQSEQQPFALLAGGRYRFHGQLRRPAQRRPARSRTWHATPGSARRSELDLQAIHLGDACLDKAVHQAQRMLEKDIPILIQGETGAGKEVFVRALHGASSRASQPLVAVNCAAIPAELVEAELFGYEKGAFTGASQKGSLGLIRKAHRGVLFLDEVGDMPLHAQARLLRVLQERCVQPLGGGEPQPVDIRLVSATNRPLRQDVDTGRFRSDLYYRVSGLNLALPPLRERSDKLALFQHLWDRYREPGQSQVIASEVLELFMRHPWPGNLRQLSSVIQVALALAENQPVRIEHLPEDFFVDLPEQKPASPTVRDDDLASLLRACGGNLSHLARQLGISRNTLYKRLRQQGMHA